MAKIWHGEYYARVKSNTLRNRRTGEIVTEKPKIIARRGKRDLIILPKGVKVLGVEERLHHFSGIDKKPILKTKVKTLSQTRARSRKEQMAMFSKMKRRR